MTAGQAFSPAKRHAQPFRGQGAEAVNKVNCRTQGHRRCSRSATSKVGGERIGSGGETSAAIGGAALVRFVEHAVDYRLRHTRSFEEVGGGFAAVGVEHGDAGVNGDGFSPVWAGTSFYHHGGLLSFPRQYHKRNVLARTGAGRQRQ
jgi:hypothetical protein